MYMLYTHPFSIKRKTETNIKAPKAILKITSGAILTSFFKYAEMCLITVTVLIRNHHTQG